MTPHDQSNTRNTEVLIVGAGPVGLALALALHRRGRSVRLADARPAGAGARDARVLALSHGTRQTLERLNAWPAIGPTPIETIHVSQRGALGRTRMQASEYGVPALGYVTPASLLYAQLKAAVDARGIEVRHDANVTALEATGDCIEAQLSDGSSLAAQLVACCEGVIQGSAESDIRSRDYGQHAIILRARLAAPHGGVAYERFTPEGPLALLPLGEDYSVVWTMPAAAADARMDLPEPAFRGALQAAFGDRVRFVETLERVRFPLGLRVRNNPVGPRTVWLGNAAQTLHPVAGQGFNLALRDVWALTETLTDVADPGDGAALARYTRARLLDRRSTIGFTDSLVRLFSNDDPLLSHARGAGLLALDLLPPLRHFVAKRMLFGARAWP
ncbi:UbiH/UbiF/VisC/COQ6 family ubiquinone biosynthesis hydroxylase [Niveibacterium umoris]|uniref:2-octaprenyl-6-methoxyphenol hydroxylase n=1 Tax=Niveibacterium umoris TaxID=1193620 RepID=A0A840BMM3_9RHOO|nr:FAD-dependent monooxygenase [Niveibacterium umoris]MBB4012902.1 2-octaprenyl-6-methoxyphenol hydroxylase [Niveibacterium umoris]